MSNHEYRIVRTDSGRYDVYIDEEFFCTTDSVVEATEKIERHIEENDC